MRIKITYFLFGLLFITLSSCDYDNFDEPNAILSGHITYNDQPIGLRTNGPQLELWQDGYALDKNIPVFIGQDGSYSVALFSGEYKLVRKEGGPWVPQLSDTLVIQVNGNTTYDVPVTPYFMINTVDFQKNGNSIESAFNLEQIVETANLEYVNIYFGESILTDQNRNEFAQGADLSTVSIDGSESTISADIPEHLQDNDYLFVRLGVKSNLSNELYYTQVEKINLN